MKLIRNLVRTSVLLATLSPPVAICSAPAHSSGEQVSHWQYSGQEGPGMWGSLKDEYALCGSGKRQSPIDIRDERPTSELYPLDMRYQPVGLRVLNNGHTLQANYNSVEEEVSVNIGGEHYPLPAVPIYNSTLILGGAPYPLIQLHFHTPSEHAREGERYAMEMHLVHKSADGNLAVVGVFMERGASNNAFQNVLDNASSEQNKVVVARNTTIDAASLLPGNHTAFHYTGSLTTPPCSENVNWFVLKDPITVSDAQVRDFVKLIGKNARPLQNVNWRTIVTSE